MTLNIPLTPETVAKLREYAAQAGKDVQTVVREAIEEKLILEGNPSSEGSVAAALAELDELRVGNRLNGLTTRQLVDEGRRL